MRRVHLVMGCITLAILLGAGSMPSKVFAQEGIVVNPENPTELDSLEITITAWCCSGPVRILNTLVEVSERLIMIVAERECGPLTVVTLYTHTVIVPPVEPNSYIVEYWVTGDCLMPPNPILSTEIIVSPVPIRAGESTWGAIKALYYQ